MFTEPEVQYLKSQRLARLATVSSKGQPDVVPVAFEFDDRYFWIGSYKQEVFLRTRKYKNVRKRNNLAALAIDDLASVVPWRPRGVRVYGTAEVLEHNGQFGPGKYLRITPKVSWAWGIEGLKGRTRTVHR